MKKSWRQKMDESGEPRLDTVPKAFAGMLAGGTMLISTPRDVAARIAAIPFGQTMTVPEFRAFLAAAHGADGCCPTSTSIFIRVAAEAAIEDMSAGRASAEVTPFWRVVDPDGPIAKRLSCDSAFIATLRALERSCP